jgi:hypothetical protein
VYQQETPALDTYFHMMKEEMEDAKSFWYWHVPTWTLHSLPNLACSPSAATETETQNPDKMDKIFSGYLEK